MDITATRPFHPTQCSQPLEVSSPEMDQAVEELAETVETFCESHAHNLSFSTRMLDLVNRILGQLNRIAEKDRKQTEELKSDYRKFSQQAADLTRKLGKMGFHITLAAFGMMLMQFAPIPFFNPDDKIIVKFLADRVPEAGQMFTSKVNADKVKVDAFTQLSLQDISARANAKGQETGQQQQALDLLRTMIDLFKRASSAQ